MEETSSMRIPSGTALRGFTTVALLSLGCTDDARPQGAAGGASFDASSSVGGSTEAMGGMAGGLGGATSSFGGDGTFANGARSTLGSGNTGGTANPDGSASLGGSVSAAGASSGGSVSAAGGTSGASGSAALPERLSETGLYASDGVTLREGVRAYSPRFELWSDGATKRRWIALPPGTTIDTTDPDFWSFPVGTKLWKEFTKNGVRVETRLIERTSTRNYQMVAYVWKVDQSDAILAVDGQPHALGTDHDVPSAQDCGTCHLNHPGRILGFSAIQLDSDAGELTLDRLRGEGLLSTAVPSAKGENLDSTAMQALGILHANCGTCHNPNSTIPYRGVDLQLRIAHLGTIQETPFYRTTVGIPAGSNPDGLTPAFLVVPGAPGASALVHRMGSRANLVAMPPLASQVVDVKGLEVVSAFISSLPPLPATAP
jgi:mono/diheme cytochrome c family protein